MANSVLQSLKTGVRQLSEGEFCMSVNPAETRFISVSRVDGQLQSGMINYGVCRSGAINEEETQSTTTDGSCLR
jgi:hypothetical protein